jgi:spore maturation protein CgeB
LSCGPLTLASYSPDSELLLEDRKYVVYFRSVDEFFELADYYLKHDSERYRIALAGMERAHKEFNCTKMAQYLLDIVERGTYDAPWATIL